MTIEKIIIPENTEIKIIFCLLIFFVGEILVHFPLTNCWLESHWSEQTLEELGI